MVTAALCTVCTVYCLHHTFGSVSSALCTVCAALSAITALSATAQPAWCHRLLRDHAPYQNRTHGLGGTFHDESLAIWASSFDLFMHTLCGWATVRSSELIKVLYQCNPDAAQTVDSAGRTPLQYALHLDNEVAIKALAAGGLVIPPETVQCGEPGVRTLFKMGFGLDLAAHQDIVIPDPPNACASEVSR